MCQSHVSFMREDISCYWTVEKNIVTQAMDSTCIEKDKFTGNGVRERSYLQITATWQVSSLQ